MKKTIEHKTPKQLLTPTRGYLKGYSHTLNPYMGCAFGCSYCYVRRLPVALFKGQEWGMWIDVKTFEKDRFRHELIRAKKKGAVTIFMSSSTDPYQPLEHRERITRSLLEVMAEEPPDFLFVQTRSPLVVRDADLFQKLKDRLLISVTVETDREEIRKALTPWAPPIPARLKALAQLKEAGLPTQAAVSPVLPSSERFADVLKAVVSRVTVDDYFMGDGSGGRRTESLGIKKIYEQIGETDWYDPSAYQTVLDRLRAVFPASQIYVSLEGFLPPAFGTVD